MTETTQSERERLLDMPVDNIVHSLCRDADRLARLEDGIRALADEKQAEAVEWDELGEYDNASEASEYAQRLYDLVGDD